MAHPTAVGTKATAVFGERGMLSAAIAVVFFAGFSFIARSPVDAERWTR